MAAGKKTGGGSRKGQPNKLTGAVREMVLAALNELGGIEYLKRQAEKNPVAFMALLGKILPLQVSGVDGGPLAIRWEGPPNGGET
jgi:hypothetical protein